MVIMIETTLGVGTTSFLATSRLDWERSLIREKPRSGSIRHALAIEIGPIRIHAVMSGPPLLREAAACPR
jgi:hypothetical protein